MPMGGMLINSMSRLCVVLSSASLRDTSFLQMGLKHAATQKPAARRLQIRKKIFEFKFCPACR